MRTKKRYFWGNTLTTLITMLMRFVSDVYDDLNIFVIDNDKARVGIGTTPDYKAHIQGTLGVNPGASVTPVNNGDVVMEVTNDTTLTFKLKGSDGVVRTGTISLS